MRLASRPRWSRARLGCRSAGLWVWSPGLGPVGRVGFAWFGFCLGPRVLLGRARPSADLGLGFRLGWVGGGVGAGPPPGPLASFSRPRSSFSSWVSFSHLRPPIRWVYGAAVISGRRAVPYFGFVFRVRPWLGGRPGSRGWARPPFPLCATKGWPPFAQSVVQLLGPPGGWSQTFVRTLVVETWTVNVNQGRLWPAMFGRGLQ